LLKIVIIIIIINPTFLIKRSSDPDIIKIKNLNLRLHPFAINCFNRNQYGFIMAFSTVFGLNVVTPGKSAYMKYNQTTLSRKKLFPPCHLV